MLRTFSTTFATAAGLFIGIPDAHAAANAAHGEQLYQSCQDCHSLDTNDVDRIMRGDNLTKPTVSDLLEKEQSRRSNNIQPGQNNSEPDIQLGGGPLPAPG